MSKGDSSCAWDFTTQIFSINLVPIFWIMMFLMLVHVMMAMLIIISQPSSPFSEYLNKQKLAH